MALNLRSCSAHDSFSFFYALRNIVLAGKRKGECRNGVQHARIMLDQVSIAPIVHTRT